MKLKLTVYFVTDAESTCDNFLTLSPPEVVGKYLETVMVNCTSLDESHEELCWDADNTVTACEDEGFGTFELSLNMSDWILKAECKIKLNHTFECSKDLKITVYSKCNFKFT